MKIRTAVALLTLMVMAMTDSAALQITQVADQAPDLRVYFVGADDDTTGVTSPAAPGRLFTATLGNSPLKVKAIGPWDKNAGISLVVALDVSASLDKTDFGVLQRQIGELLAAMAPASRVALFTIGAEVRQALPFGPAAAAREAIDRLAPEAQQTALYEAVIATQRYAASASRDLPERHFVLLVTDGIDESRKGFGADEVRQRVAANDAPVFALVLGPPRLSRVQSEAARSLAQIARASGGDAYQATRATVADGLLALMKKATQVEVLVLDCAACAHDSVPRTLRVGLKVADSTRSDERAVRLYPLSAGDPLANPASEAAALPAAAPASTPADVWRHWLKKWWWQIGLIGLTVIVVIGGGIYAWSRTRKPVPVDPDSDSKTSGRDRGGQGDLIIVSASSSRRPEPPPPPAAPSVPELQLTLDVASLGRMHVRIGSGDLVLGRAASADVTVDHDAEASNRHAALFRDKSALVVRDLGSANGTYLNGTRIVRPEPVHDRDLIVVGRTEVRVYFGSL
jgi:hypothetical protein